MTFVLILGDSASRFGIALAKLGDLNRLDLNESFEKSCLKIKVTDVKTLLLELRELIRVPGLSTFTLGKKLLTFWKGVGKF